MTDRVSLWAMRLYWQLRDREQGQAAVEYGVLLAVVLAVVIGLYVTIGGDIKNALTSVKTSLESAKP